MLRRMMSGIGLGLAGALCCSVLLAAAPSHTPVADAAMVGNVATVRSLLTHGADVNAAQQDGMTALHWAAINGDVDLAKMLLYAGADVSASTRVGGFTALDIAAKDGHAAMVEALLKGGADANGTDVHGTTPLMLAAESGSVQAVNDLLAAGAKVNATEQVKHETALMFASANGRTDVVNALLDHGADWKPATSTVDWAHLPKGDPRLPDFSRYFKSGGKAGAKKGPTQGGAGRKADAKKSAANAPKAENNAAANASPKAATEAAPKDAKLAMPKKADGKAKKDGASDAVVALPNRGQQAGAGGGAGSNPFLQYPRLVGKQGGLTALLFASRQGYTDTVEALLKHGADVNEVDPGDNTSPLLIAVINGRFDLAEKLLQAGANPNLAQKNGVTPLYAVLNCVWSDKALYPQPTAYKQQQTDHITLMRDLLKHGANPNVRLKEPVWYAAYNFDQRGLDATGATPFWRAAYGDDVPAMKLLVKYGANPNIWTKKPKARAGFYNKQKALPKDPSGMAPVPDGGPDVSPLLAASGEGYGWSLTSNHHRYAPTGMLAAVKYLVEDLHADVNARDADGNSALHNAAARGDNAMILYLVSRGANIKALNRSGQSVADMANGPVQRVSPYPKTIALAERLGAKLLHKCVSCGG